MAQAPFRINPALVAIANDYTRLNSKNRGYIADRVAPRIGVEAPLFEYPEFPMEGALLVPDTQVGRLGRLNEITETFEMVAGAVKDWGIASPLPYRDLAAAQAARIPLNLKVRAVQNTFDKVQLAREVRVANLAFSAGSYLADHVHAVQVADQWQKNGSKPFALIAAKRMGMIVPPNVAVMSERVKSVLLRHPEGSVLMGGSAESGRKLTDQELAALLGVERIEVGNAIRQTSAKKRAGGAVTTAPIWGDHLALIYQPTLNADGTAVTDADPAFLLTFQWGGNVAGEVVDPDMGLYGGERVRAGESLIEKRVAPFAGFLFTNVVSPLAAAGGDEI